MVLLAVLFVQPAGGWGIGPSIDPQLDRGDADTQIPYWNNTTRRWVNSDEALFGWDFTNNCLNLEAIQWNLTPSQTPAEGKMYWNADDGTLNLGMPGGEVNLQIGQEMIKRVLNDTVSTILNGTPVYISGESGNTLTIEPADASFALGVAFRTYAVATEDILAGQRGFVTKSGTVRDFDLSTFAGGVALYLAVGGSGAVENFYTTVPPTAPDVTVLIGVVEKATASGELDVTITTIPNYNSLSDVLQTSLADGDVMTWTAASDVWENTKTLTGFTFDGTSGFSGPWTWAGDSIADWADNNKEIQIGNNGLIITVPALGSREWFNIDLNNGDISFGNATDSPIAFFLGDGGIETGGSLIIDGGAIGVTADPDLMELADSQLDINGDLVNSGTADIGCSADGTWLPAGTVPISGDYVNMACTGTARYVVQGVLPSFSFVETDGAVDAKQLAAFIQGGIFRLRVVDDDQAGFQHTPIEISMSTGEITANNDITVNGDVDITGTTDCGTSCEADAYTVDGAAGLSATYTFGGGGTGDIATMTFSSGILTAVTTVP